jgi:predicted anti-sigma-YlaC factor YlaD
MMNCDAVRALLPHHPDPDESPAVRDAVSAHLLECRTCAEAWRQLRASWKALDAWDDVSPSPGFPERVRARVGRRKVARRAWIPLAAAAGLLLAIAAAFLLLPGSESGKALTPAEIEIVRHLDLLENFEMAEAVDLLDSGASIDELTGLLDLLPATNAGAAAPKVMEY